MGPALFEAARPLEHMRQALCQELKSLAERAAASGLRVEVCGLCEHPIAVDTETPHDHAVCEECEAEITECEQPFEPQRPRPACS